MITSNTSITLEFGNGDIKVDSGSSKINSKTVGALGFANCERMSIGPIPVINENTDLDEYPVSITISKKISADTLIRAILNARRFIEDDSKDMLLETTAEAVHYQWSHWMDHIFISSKFNKEDGSMTIPAELVERWTRQMNTRYSDLSEEEKNSERREAVKILNRIGGISIE